MTVGGVFLLAMLVAVAVVDFRTYRIPDLLSLPLIGGGLLWAAFGQEPWTDHLFGAVLGYASLAGFGAIYFRLRGREGLGLGDAKLFSAAGAWLGWQALPLVLATASLAGLLFAVAIIVATSRDRLDGRLAFGPWIALATWLYWLVAR